MQNEQDEQNNQQDSDNLGTDPDVPVVHIPLPEHPHHATVEAQHRKHYIKRSVEIIRESWPSATQWTAIAALVAAIATTVYAWYAYKQWDTLSTQLQELKRQYPELQKSANAAIAANSSAHDALTRSNRPWIGMESVRIITPIGFIKAGSGKDITYFVSGSLEVTIKNFGTSPGLSVKDFIEAYDPAMMPKEAFDPTDPFAPLRKFGEAACTLADGKSIVGQNPRLHGGALFPSQATTYTTIGIPGFSKTNFQVGQFMQLVGCISYIDQFGEIVHHTHYCVIAPVGVIGQVNNCEANTDAD